MQNGPNKVDVTPNNTWRNLQLMQIQVDLKWTKNTKHWIFFPKIQEIQENVTKNQLIFGAKNQDFLARELAKNNFWFLAWKFKTFCACRNWILGQSYFLGCWAKCHALPWKLFGRQNCEGYVKSLLKSSKVKICLSRSRIRTYIEWRKSRFVTPEKVFRSRNHDVILGSRRFPIYSPNLRLRPINF